MPARAMGVVKHKSEVTSMKLHSLVASCLALLALGRPAAAQLPAIYASGVPSTQLSVQMFAPVCTVLGWSASTGFTCSASGTVAVAGTPTNGQLAQWTGANTLQGIASPLSPALGGTGVANNSASTFTISGNFPLTATIAASANVTVPSGTNTMAALNLADQTQSGGVTLTAFSIGTVSSGTTTVDCGKNPVQFLLNAGAFTLAAPANDGACLIQSVQGPSAGAITLSGFATSPSGSGDTLATANSSTATVTFSNGSANIGWTQTLTAGQPVYFTTSGSLPTNFTANTIYYVLSSGLSGSNVQAATSPGGSAIVAGSAGSGTQTGHVPAVFTGNILRVNSLSTLIWKQQQ
jgi:hypothetical protein